MPPPEPEAPAAPGTGSENALPDLTQLVEDGPIEDTADTNEEAPVDVATDAEAQPVSEEATEDVPPEGEAPVEAHEEEIAPAEGVPPVPEEESEILIDESGDVPPPQDDSIPVDDPLAVEDSEQPTECECDCGSEETLDEEPVETVETLLAQQGNFYDVPGHSSLATWDQKQKQWMKGYLYALSQFYSLMLI